MPSSFQAHHKASAEKVRTMEKKSTFGGSCIHPSLISLLIPVGPRPLFDPPSTPPEDGVVTRGEPPFGTVVVGVPVPEIGVVVTGEVVALH